MCFMGHGKRHHESGHCTARNGKDTGTIEMAIHCMEYMDRGTRYMVTALSGSYGQKRHREGH